MAKKCILRLSDEMLEQNVYVGGGYRKCVSVFVQVYVPKSVSLYNSAIQTQPFIMHETHFYLLFLHICRKRSQIRKRNIVHSVTQEADNIYFQAVMKGKAAEIYLQVMLLLIIQNRLTSPLYPSFISYKLQYNIKVFYLRGDSLIILYK